jgi:hypothetical protein
MFRANTHAAATVLPQNLLLVLQVRLCWLGSPMQSWWEHREGRALHVSPAPSTTARGATACQGE